jgi:hypothetical protein
LARETQKLAATDRLFRASLARRQAFTANNGAAIFTFIVTAPRQNQPQCQQNHHHTQTKPFPHHNLLLTLITFSHHSLITHSSLPHSSSLTLHIFTHFFTSSSHIFFTHLHSLIFTSFSLFFTSSLTHLHIFFTSSFFILSPLSGIVPGGQSTALRRRCALDERAINSSPRKARQTLSAQPPQCGALPAHRRFPE